MKLAEAFGITDYPAPAGGCLLTDVGFSRRLKDLFEHQGDCHERDFELLKYGRHFRLHENHKVIVGRTKGDNKHILKLTDAKRDILLRMTDMASPTILIPSGAPQDIVAKAAILCTAYSKAQVGESARVTVKDPVGTATLTVQVGTREAFEPHIL
jgi:hypothetical protein